MKAPYPEGPCPVCHVDGRHPNSSETYAQHRVACDALHRCKGCGDHFFPTSATSAHRKQCQANREHVSRSASLARKKEYATGKRVTMVRLGQLVEAEVTQLFADFQAWNQSRNDPDGPISGSAT